VSVEQGRVRIATPDGLREIELGAGQSAYANGADGAALAFRRSAAAPLESVEAIVVPAMHPRAEIREGRSTPFERGTDLAGSRASSSGAAASEAVVPITKAAFATRTAATPLRAAAPHARPQPAHAARPAMPAGGAVAVRPAIQPRAGEGRVVPPPSEAARGAIARQEGGEERSEAPPPTAFDRLSDGMVNGLPGVLRMRNPPADARRPF
jgi:hypothetical protein